MADGLLAYILADGRVACVDCECFPPDSEEVRQNSDVLKHADLRCSFCGQALKNVTPVGRSIWA